MGQPAPDATRIDIEEARHVIIEHEDDEWEIFVDDNGALAILRPERFARHEALQEQWERHMKEIEERHGQFE